MPQLVEQPQKLKYIAIRRVRKFSSMLLPLRKSLEDTERSEIHAWLTEHRWLREVALTGYCICAFPEACLSPSSIPIYRRFSHADPGVLQPLYVG
jgi:hypothetical protein